MCFVLSANTTGNCFESAINFLFGKKVFDFNFIHKQLQHPENCTFGKDKGITTQMLFVVTVEDADYEKYIYMKS